MEQTSARSLHRDEELSVLPMDQLVYRYLDEIFSDYRDHKVALSEVFEEIKGIIDVLVARRPDLASLPKLSG